jgi:hypothetical protein
MRLPLYCDYIGEEDDVGDISYDSFHQNMDLFRHNRFLNVGESDSNNICFNSTEKQGFSDLAILYGLRSMYI